MQVANHCDTERTMKTKRLLTTVLAGIASSLLSTTAFTSDEIQVSPLFLDFPSVQFGFDMTNTVQVYNVSDHPVTISYWGPEDASFIAFSSCDTLQPQGSCAVDVTFHPLTVGYHTGTIDIRSENDLQLVQLSGNSNQF